MGAKANRDSGGSSRRWRRRRRATTTTRRQKRRSSSSSSIKGPVTTKTPMCKNRGPSVQSLVCSALAKELAALATTTTIGRRRDGKTVRHCEWSPSPAAGASPSGSTEKIAQHQPTQQQQHRKLFGPSLRDLVGGAACAGQPLGEIRTETGPRTRAQQRQKQKQQQRRRNSLEAHLLETSDETRHQYQRTTRSSNEENIRQQETYSLRHFRCTSESLPLGHNKKKGGQISKHPQRRDVLLERGLTTTAPFQQADKNSTLNRPAVQRLAPMPRLAKGHQRATTITNGNKGRLGEGRGNKRTREPGEENRNGVRRLISRLFKPVRSFSPSLSTISATGNNNSNNNTPRHGQQQATTTASSMVQIGRSSSHYQWRPLPPPTRSNQGQSRHNPNPNHHHHHQHQHQQHQNMITDEMEQIKASSRAHQWYWSETHKSHECVVGKNKLSLVFHPTCSESAAACRASEPLKRNGNYYYWEIHVQDKIYGTSVMFGLCTSQQRLHANDYCNLVGLDECGWSLTHKGLIWHNGLGVEYTSLFPSNQPITVGLLFNTMRGELSYFMNGKNLGVAFTGLNKIRDELYPVVASTAKCTQMRLIGSYCGYVSLLERSCFTLLESVSIQDRAKLIEYLRKQHLPKHLLEYVAQAANVNSDMSSDRREVALKAKVTCLSNRSGRAVTNILK